MREIDPASESNPASLASAAGSAAPTEHASRWRAFFSVLLMGLCVSGNVRLSPADFETRYQWQQMIMGVAACSFGALASACFAIKWRKLDAYWSIVWRIYVVYVAGAFLAGVMHGGGVAGYATGAALIAGMLTATSGVALFYWRNTGTNVLFYFGCFLLALGLIKVVLS